MSDQRAFPDEDETEDNQRHIHHCVPKEQNIEHPPRIVPEGPQKRREGRMLQLKALNLVAFEREKRRFQTRKQRRAEYQNDDRAEKNDETSRRHPSLPERDSRTLVWKKNRPRLPVISVDPRLIFK